MHDNNRITHTYEKNSFFKDIVWGIILLCGEINLVTNLKSQKKVCTSDGLKLKEKLNYKVNNKQVKYYLCY